MELYELNPFIRFADTIYFHSENYEVQVRDCRIFYILSGEAELFIQNQHYQLIPNSLFYCCAKSRYRIHSSGISLISLNFDLSQNFRHNTAAFSPVRVSSSSNSTPAFTGRCLTDKWQYEPVDSGNCLNTHFFLPDAQLCQECIAEILNEFSTQRIYFHERSNALLKELLIQLLRYRAEPSTNAGDAVSKTIAYLKTNYAEPLTNQSISAITGYHEYHLNRIFLKQTGTSIHQYLLSLRINAAKKLLMNTSHSMSLIADETGFGSKTHFSSAFKKIVGMTPSEYRQKFQNSL